MLTQYIKVNKVMRATYTPGKNWGSAWSKVSTEIFVLHSDPFHSFFSRFQLYARAYVLIWTLSPCRLTLGGASDRDGGWGDFPLSRFSEVFNKTIIWALIDFSTFLFIFETYLL